MEILVHMETEHLEIYNEFKEKNLILVDDGSVEDGDQGNRKVRCN